MTEKRFRISQGYTDRFCHDWQNNQLLNFRETVDLLNELAEENQQLQQKLKYAEKVNTSLIDENHRLRLTIIHSSDLNFDINWLKENLKDWNNYE